MKLLRFGTLLLLVSVLLVTNTFEVTAQACKPNGQVKARPLPPGECDGEDDCCIPGKLYNTYLCSPPVSNKTKAVLTLNSFFHGGDLPTACDSKYHSDNELVVGLSTGWYNRGERCHKTITVSAKGKSVKALVVDECDSSIGCDASNAYQPPCQNNVVEASKAVWESFGIPRNDWTELDITWSDAW